MTPVIVESITKTYGQKKSLIHALKPVSFEVQKGEIFGIIGPDGAGKTSLFRILTTLLLPDSGKAWVDGLDVVEKYKDVRKRMGYMPGKFSLYQDLSVEENLQFFATIFNTSIEANYDLIKDIYIQIEPFKKRKAGQLSGGMKQKLALSCALIHRPSVLFLDEPTTGVDAVSRREFWHMLKGLQKNGITILVSTPYMDEANLCDRVALIQKGKIMSLSTPEEITQSFVRPLWAVKATNKFQLLNDLRQKEYTSQVYPFGEFLHLVTHEEVKENFLQIDLERPGLEVSKVKPNIEDVFMDKMRDDHGA